jgi:hypothetical protein
MKNSRKRRKGAMMRLVIIGNGMAATRLAQRSPGVLPSVCHHRHR